MKYFSLPIFLFLLFFSISFAAFITPHIIDSTSSSSSSFHMIVDTYHTNETESSMFILGTIISLGMFILLFGMVSLLPKKHYLLIEKIIKMILPGILLGILLFGEYPFPFSLVTDYRFWLVTALIISIQVFFTKKPFSSIVLEILLFLTIAKYAFPAFLELDSGLYLIHPPDFDQYRPITDKLTSFYALFILGIVFLMSILPSSHQWVKKMNKRKILRLLIPTTTFILIGAALLPILTLPIPQDGIDFTILPALHIVRGGIPFASTISQYGYLYLAPWIIWLSLFSFVATTQHLMILVSTGFLFLFFIFFYYVVFQLSKHHLLACLTTLSLLYYTLVLRSWYYPDLISMVGAPAFGPLRFGILILPFYFLTLFITSKKTLYLKLFLIVSSCMMLFSFEVGIGLALSAFVSTLLYSVVSGNRKKLLIPSIVTIVITLFIIGLSIIFLTFITKGVFPSFAYYTFFTQLFSSGFYLFPIGTQGIVLIPLIIVFISTIVGIKKMSDKNPIGLALLYLALCQLVLLPYYMGRSLPPVLYSILTPSILMSAILGYIAYTSEDSILTRAGTYIFLGLLVLGSTRLIVSVYDQWKYPEATVSSIQRILFKPVQSVQTKAIPAYNFLTTHLPSHQQVLLFDDDETELLLALPVRSLDPFPFLRNYVLSQEQVDLMLTSMKGKPFYLFKNDDEFIPPYPDYVYRTIWSMVEPYAEVVADEPPFHLYKITIPNN